MESAKAYGSQAWSSAIGFLNSDGLIPQLVLTVVIILAIHLIITTVESLVLAVKKYNQLSATLLPDTHMSDTKKEALIRIDQTPEGGKYPFMYPSENEVNGMEFSYSFHLYIDPANFDSTSTNFRNIFYKGSANGPGATMAPGVFLSEAENAIRVYMNTVAASSAENYVEIPNIPVGKWFHMIIVQRGQNMDVYINGNVAVRKTFLQVPVINYGGIYVFSKGTYSNTGTDADNLSVSNCMEGMISRLKYYAYALSYNQIDSLYTEGPSSKIVSTSFDFRPPYLHDSWWVTRYNSGNRRYGL
jgi:hypothetical protein